LRDLTGIRVESLGDEIVIRFTPLADPASKN
jgi:hypothetical protein